jgi:N6-L-threonylcarbamoyladenine synthase
MWASWRAKGLAFAREKPFLAINHLEGMRSPCGWTEQVEFPYLLLLVSGGHCQLLTVRGSGRLHACSAPPSTTAVGECFDKTAKLLGLGFPGGPGGRAGGEGGDRAALRPAAADVAQAGLRLLLLRPEDGGAPAVEKLPRTTRRRSPISAPPSSAPSATCWPTAAPMRLRWRPRHAGRGGRRRRQPLSARPAREAAAARLVAPPVKLCTDNGA